MKHLFLIGLGGFIGSIARYKLGEWMMPFSSFTKLPFHTFFINSLGCFFIGFLNAFLEKHNIINGEIRPLLIIGLLGGFTTFSTFGSESFDLFKKSEFFIAILYICLTVIIGVLSVWIGNKCGGFNFIK